MGCRGDKIEQVLSVSTIQVLCLTLKKFFHKLLPTKKYQAKPEGEEKKQPFPQNYAQPSPPLQKTNGPSLTGSKKTFIRDRGTK